MQLPYKDSVPSSSVDEGYFVRLFAGLLLPLLFSQNFFPAILSHYDLCVGEVWI